MQAYPFITRACVIVPGDFIGANGVDAGGVGNANISAGLWYGPAVANSEASTGIITGTDDLPMLGVAVTLGSYTGGLSLNGIGLPKVGAKWNGKSDPLHATSLADGSTITLAHDPRTPPTAISAYLMVEAQKGTGTPAGGHEVAKAPWPFVDGATTISIPNAQKVGLRVWLNSVELPYADLTLTQFSDHLVVDFSPIRPHGLTASHSGIFYTGDVVEVSYIEAG
jgi:hypothetical protein